MFKKGASGNPTGRPQGTPNKVNQEIRERINDFLESNFDEIKADVKQLEPKDRIKFYIDLLSFGLPRLKNVEMDVTHDNFIATIDLTHEEIRNISKCLENDF